ncbi:MAG: hypothetical protein LBD60_04505 [Puniceicoccales bacterium]|jgi:hypothetical protein|nr:hypothetical protein [Puniceicoccales bacterium]
MRLFRGIILILVSSSVVMATDSEPTEESISFPQEQPVIPPEYQELAEYQEVEYSAPYSNNSDGYFDESYFE